jgi:hypothetical protein
MGPIVYNVSLLIHGGPIGEPTRLPSYVPEVGSAMSITKVASRAAFARILLCGFDEEIENHLARVYRVSREAGFSPAESAFAAGLMLRMQKGVR